MEEKVTMGLKSLIDGEIGFKFELRKILKESSIRRINKDFYLKNPKKRTSLKQVKFVKALHKHPKLKVVINFK